MADADNPAPKTLPQAIRDRDNALEPIFEPAFATPEGWRNFLHKHFGAPPSVSTILEREGRLHTVDFQALYVACWLHTPVEKGTYLIPLTREQRVRVRAGYDKLGLRWSSHLNGHGRSAAKGWAFLKGYRELLVQLVGGGKADPDSPPFLFLKCEGETAFTVQHIEGYKKKSKGDGAGETCNAALNALAAQGRFGFQLRLAENFDMTPYAVLLERLDLADKTTTVQTMTGHLFDVCRQLGESGQFPELPAFDKLALAVGLFPDTAPGEFPRMPNSTIAWVIELLLLPTFGALAGRLDDPQRRQALDPAVLSLVESVNKAAPTLRELSRRLHADLAIAGRPIVPRYYFEVTVSPDALDAALARFLHDLEPPALKQP